MDALRSNAAAVRERAAALEEKGRVRRAQAMRALADTDGVLTERIARMGRRADDSSRVAMLLQMFAQELEAIAEEEEPLCLEFDPSATCARCNRRIRWTGEGGYCGPAHLDVCERARDAAAKPLDQPTYGVDAFYGPIR